MENDVEPKLEAQAILTQVIADFEQLDLTIELAIGLIKESKGQADKDIDALLRARDAARKGAALAKRNIETQDG